MLKYGFFNSMNGDRTYDADDISSFFYKLISNGVFVNPSTSLQVMADSGMTVTVSEGYGMINAKYVNNTSPLYLTLDSADPTNPRKDRVVMGLNYANRNITVYIKKGTAAADPAPPALTQSVGVLYELSLATIAISAGNSAITQADITDDRPDSNLCGYITGMIQQIDTSTLFAQFTAAYNEWFENLTETLTLDVFIGRETNTYITSVPNEITIPIGISDFDSSQDTLSVYVSGLRLTPEIDYSISGSNIVLTTAISLAGTVIVFDVLKASAVNSGSTPVNTAILAHSAGNSIIGTASYIGGNGNGD